jgi:hypothetical protein
MLIGISGKAQAGKDTFARHLLYAYGVRSGRNFSYKPMYYGYNALAALVDVEIRRFADKLKQIVSILTGIEVSAMEDPIVKGDPMGPKWGDRTLRELLQNVGTDLLKSQLNADVWVDALMRDFDPIDSHWIVTDVRFPNEAKAIRDEGGTLVRINRPDIKLTDHACEVSLDNWDNWDMVVENDKGIDKLNHFANELIGGMFKGG